MRLSTPLLVLVLLAGTASATALAPPVAPRAPQSRVAKATKAKPVMACSAKATTVAAAPVTHRARRAHRSVAPRTVAAPAPAQAGMVVAVDPETGVLGMPTSEQLQALGLDQSAAYDDSDAGLVEVHHPDGTVSIDLQGRFQEYSVIRITPDGKKIMACVPTRAQAARVLAIPPSTPALEVK